MLNNHYYCIIMAGGVGSRFWPVSRADLPKQFLDFNIQGRSFLRRTYDRMKAIIPEKNILVVSLDRYRDLVKRCELAPILLFNEADAIFGVRKNGAENAVDKMENTIQNIILQEMENLQGIMIATTNLQGNLDSAFDRRFLYKVKFEKPDAAVRCSIWQEMVSGLSDSDAMALARAFELSGGQIENVARKDTINRILHGDRIDHLAILMDYCRHESLDKATSRQPMGFK